jgi:tetratricopeptide (TPR) repeat protein
MKWILTGLIFLALGLLSAAVGMSPILPPLAAVFGIILAILWGRDIGELVARPFTSMFDGGAGDAEPTPFYSIAQARRKRGEYDAAVGEVMKQLERFPHDFEGWMLLAEIQAEDLHDIAAAMDAVEHTLSLPDAAPKNVAYALNRAADWELKLRQDPAAAMHALERIVALLPDTELAQITLQRIAQIQHAPPPRQQGTAPVRLTVPRAERRLGLKTAAETPPTPAGVDPAAEAGVCVRRLEEMPEDHVARERLAMIYAEHYQRLDLAEEQLEQMITSPHQPARQVVHWLNLMADLQIRLGDSEEKPRATLQRIVDLYPGTAHAEIAAHRLARLGLDFRAKETSQAIKLGSYEKNLGLK